MLLKRCSIFHGMRKIQLLSVFAGLWILAIVQLATRLVNMDRQQLGSTISFNSQDLYAGLSLRTDDCAPCRCPERISWKYVSGGVPEVYGKAHHELCIWPRLNDSRDRVLPQMDLDRSTGELYWIYVSHQGLAEQANQSYLSEECPVNNCRMMTDQLAGADVIVLQDYDLWMHENIRRQKVLGSSGKSPIVVWYMLESPLNRGSYRQLNDLVNWTATYRRDSIINTPYERFTFYKQYEGILPPPERNFAANKTKKVAAFISNCHDSNGRLNYVRELKRYIDVDIYGSCGELACPRTHKKPDPCFEKLKNDYKFYLAFENSNCRHYITEKFFWNALLNDVLPVVMGAAPEDYLMAAPPNSYIHVDDFKSPQHLAAYLHHLDVNDHVYNEYFRWKGSGSYINTKFWCRLCAIVNESKLTGAKVWYGDLEKWWNGPGVCARRGNKTWASWNDVETKYGYVDSDTLYVQLQG